jgi:hypothetical protein
MSNSRDAMWRSILGARARRKEGERERKGEEHVFAVPSKGFSRADR